MRGDKGSYYEGGIREPFMIRRPGIVRPYTRCEVPVINVDLYPTFLDAAGATVPQGKVLDGESLLPLLRGEGQLKREAIFWHFPGYLNSPVIRGREMLDTKNAVELYSLADDIAEHTRLTGHTFGRVLLEVGQKLRQVHASTGDAYGYIGAHRARSVPSRPSLQVCREGGSGSHRRRRPVRRGGPASPVENGKIELSG